MSTIGDSIRKSIRSGLTTGNKKKSYGFNLEPEKSYGFNLEPEKNYGFKLVPEMSRTIQSPDGTRSWEVSYDAYDAIRNGNLYGYKPKDQTEAKALSEFRKYEGFDLKMEDGTDYGKVSYDAIKAVEGGTLDSYKPKSNTEKTIIDKFKSTQMAEVPLELPEGKKETVKLSLSALSAIKNNQIGEYKPTEKEKADWEKFTTSLVYPLSREYEGKDGKKTKMEFGLISARALDYYNKNQSFEGYKPVNAREESAIGIYLDSFTGETPRKSGSLLEAVVSTPLYLAGKTAAGLAGSVFDTVDYLGAGLMWAGSKVTTGSWSENLKAEAESLLRGDYNFAQQYSDDLEHFYNVPDWARNNAAGAFQSVGNILGVVASEATSGGASPAGEIAIAKATAKYGKLGKYLATAKTSFGKGDAVFFGSAAGSYARQAYEMSGDIDKSLAYGTLMGAAEAATERIFSGFAGLNIGEGVVNDVLKSAPIKIVSKAANSKGGKLVLDLAGEAVEEMLISVADPFMQYGTGVNKNATLASGKEVFESGLQGMFVSAILGVSAYPFRNAARKNSIAEVNKDVDTVNTLLGETDTKIELLGKKATVEDIEAKQKEVNDRRRRWGVSIVNSTANGINSMLHEDSEKKISLLGEKATFDDIEAKQKEIESFIDAYTEMAENAIAPILSVAENAKVKAGDTFKDTKLGNTITVVERDEKNTVVEINNGTKVERKVYTNEQADTLITNSQYEKLTSPVSETIETPAETVEIVETPAENVPVDGAAPSENAVDVISADDAVDTESRLVSDSTKETTPAVAQGVTVGDTFRDTKLGNTITVVKRDGANTTVEINNGQNVERKVYPNANADVLVSNGQYEKIESGEMSGPVADTEVINHSGEIEGLKLIGTEESTLVNGKTLITGVYELNSDKDFSRKSYKKEEFDVFYESEPWVKKVSGVTYGHYGFTKSERGGYAVIYLPVGLNITKANTEKDSKLILKTLDDKLPELPLSIKAFGDGYRRFGVNRELVTEIKDVIESVNGHTSDSVAVGIQDGKVPFHTKAELIEYVKTHKGDSIRVTFDNGVSEVRTLESISNTSLRTKRPDGSISNAELKGLKFNDTGFAIDYSTGVSVTFDFVNVSDATIEDSSKNESTVSENFTAPLKNEKEGAIIEKESEVPDNGIDGAREIPENDKRHSEVQVTETGQTVQDRGSDSAHRESPGKPDGSRDRRTSRRAENIESRKIEDVVEGEKFIRFAMSVGNGLTVKSGEMLDLKYGNDERLDVYDFSDVIAYDMLSDPDNELRALFSDEIAEYFNNVVDPTCDTTGAKVPVAALKGTKTSVVKDEHGQLIPLYHATDKDFNKFEVGDVGFHFGSYAQAHKLATNKEFVENARFIKAYLNITSPLIIDHDNPVWTAPYVVQDLMKMGILDSEQGAEYIRHPKAPAEANKEIRNFLKAKGYDGIIYKNEIESGYADSYIVFDDSQIFRIDAESKESATDVHTGVLEEENTDTDRGRESESVQSAEKAEDAGRESGNIGGRSVDANEPPVSESKADAPSEESVPGRTDDDGVGERDDSNGDDGGNNNLDNSGDETVKEKAPADKPKNYSMTKDVAEYIDNKPPSKADNLEAIRVLHELENSGKKPTKAQLEALAKYKGWGGLSGAFSSWQIKELESVMTEEEIKAARATVGDAYYTPTYVIDAVYKALNRLGFEGGNVLEPSMGIGNFFSKMPKKVMDASKLFGVEIDGVSGRIASYLHPDAQITIDGYQNVAYKDGAFDLIVGNVPFGDIKLPYKGKKYLIHDFFFRKSLDKLTDGGVMVLVTSKGTMDKADYSLRAELASQADLVAAYRLPASVFDKSAGASVATDIIIMQKKEGGSSNGVNFKNIGNIKGIAINEYFVEHPENIIGELTLRRNQFGKDVSTVVAKGDVGAALTKAMSKLPKGLLNGVSTTGAVDVTEFTGTTQSYTENGKNVEFVDAATGEVKTITGKKATVAKDYIKLRDTYNKLINASLNDEGTSTIETLRKELKNTYKAFTDKHGYVTKHKGTLSDDVDFVKVSGLEVYDTKTKSFIPSEVFEKDTLTRKKPAKADNALDALGISIGEIGKVDVKLISQLTGKSESDVLSELADKIILTPDGTYELNEVYLSGNIREKLRQVEGKKGFERNAEMLKAAMPEEIKAKDIVPQFGAPWIEPKYISEFLKETLNLYNTPGVSYDSTTGTWVVQHVWGDHTLMTKKYGTSFVDAMAVAEKALNMREIRVRNKAGLTLVGETRAAQQKAEDLRNAFEEWCFKNSDRRNELVRIFNEKFNSYRSMDFSALAEHLTFAGMSDAFKPRDYQRRAVARVVFNGNTLLAHGVGTGKTAEMIASAMELKRLGVVKKNMMVVPNHKPDDFRNDILKMYPSAKVIMLGAGKTTKPADRQKFFAQVASGDWDICIVPHSVFGLLDVAPDTKRAFIQNQIDELEEVLTLSQLDKGRSLDGRFVRQLENQKKKLQLKLEAVTEAKKDKGMVFEELGVDSIFVDEAHNFKSLPFYTKLARVAGVSSSESSRAENMFMVTDYVNRTGGRVNFATATPITNSMTEIYNMIRFLRPDILKEAGIGSFDAWASMFGSIVNEAEVDPTGRNMRMKERFSKFKNVQQMVEQFRRVADVLKTGDVIEELPEVERIDVINETNDIQEEFLDILNDMVAKIQSGGQKDATLNMLTVTKAGQMAAIDLRMVVDFFEGKYSLDDLNLAGNRISKVVERVYNEYTDSKDIKGTQFIFCDEGVRDNPDGRYRLNVYNDLINRLVAAGIPRNEIAVAQDFSDKADLSGKVNTGEIRVLIGSTQVMGEGMNAQERAVALHHVTVPYRPSDIEQREGRIIRFGNINKNVRIYRYIQERSYDSYQWQMQERKANFINQALSNGNASELEEMSDFVLTAREAKAIASGNPLLLEKMDVEDKLNKLKLARNRFNSDKLDMQDRLKTLPARVEALHKEAADLKADADTVAKNKSDDFKIKLYAKSFTERAAAAEHLALVLAKVPKNGEAVKVGEYLGLDVLYSTSVQYGSEFTLKGVASHKVDAGDSALGNITRLTNLANKLADEADNREGMAKHFESELKTLEEEVKAEFPQAKELAELQAKLDGINEKIGAKDEVDMSTVVVDDSSDSDAEERISGYRRAVDAGVNDSADVETENVWKAEKTEAEKPASAPATKAPAKPTKTVKVPSLSELMKDIRDSFGIVIATGKVTDRRAQGIFKNRAEVIRTRTANDLPTAVHELGHFFDKKYKLSNSKYIDEARPLAEGGNLDLDAYTAEELPGELAAEFVRRYFKHPGAIAKRCPNLTKDFLSRLAKEDAKSVARIAPKVHAYMSANLSDQYSATIITAKEAKKLNRPSASERASEAVTEWIDGFHPIKQAVDFVEETAGDALTGNKNAYKLAINSLNSQNITNFVLTEGFRDLDGNLIKGAESLADCLKTVDIADDKERGWFDLYLKLRHSLEVNARGKLTFGNDLLEDPENIKKQIAKIEKARPEFKAASEKLYAFERNVLKEFAVKAGLVTQKTADFLNDTYPCYVPFYRYVEKKNNKKGKKSIANQYSPIMRMKGSGLDTMSPLESIIKNTERIITASIKHQAASVLTGYADSVDGFGSYIERIPPDQLKKTVDITALKENFNDKLQEVVSTSKDFFAVSELLDEVFGNEVSEYTPVVNESKGIIAVQKGGTRQYYQVHDRALLKAITEFSPKQLKGGLKLCVDTLRITNALITQYNPLFGLTNPIRDARTAYKLGDIDNPAKFAKAYARALYTILSNTSLAKSKGRYIGMNPVNSEDYQQFRAMGGGHSSSLTAEMQSISRTLAGVYAKDKGLARRLTHAVMHHPIRTVTGIDALSALSDFTESIPRFMTFQYTYEKTGDLQEAIYAADDITTNFKKRGSGTAARIANGAFRFNNAALQGLDKTTRTFKDASPERRLKLAGKWILDATLIAILQCLFNRAVDEEGWDNLSSYKKNNFYNVAIGDGEFISLPKERENAVLNSLIERTVDKMMGEDDAFYDFGGYLASQLLPPMLSGAPDLFTGDGSGALHEALNNTLVGGFADIGFNKDFKGTPIETKYEKDLPSNERYDSRTTALAYNLGQTKFAVNRDLSPKKIDHLLSFFLGSISSTNKALFPKDKSQRDLTVGLRNRFVSDSAYSTDVLNKVYENRDLAERDFKYEGTIDKAIEYEQNAMVADFISEMNRAIRALPEEEQRDGRKYLLGKLNTWDYEMSTQQSIMLSSLEGEENLTNHVVENEFMHTSLFSWTDDKQKYEYQMSPQEYYDDYVKVYLSELEKARSKHSGGTAEAYEEAKREAREFMSEYKKTTLKEKYFNRATKIED